jgi:hypothetical protein
MPYIIRLFIIAVLSLSFRVNYPAVSYSWAMGRSSQVRMKME